MSKKEDFLQLWEQARSYVGKEKEKIVSELIDDGILDFLDDGDKELEDQVNILTKQLREVIKEHSNRDTLKSNTVKSKAVQSETKTKSKEASKESEKKTDKMFVRKEIEQVSIIREFLRLHGKTATEETRESIRRLLARLQKAILNQVIRKDGFGEKSLYGEEIMLVQKYLVATLNNYKIGQKKLAIPQDDFNQLKKIAKGTMTDEVYKIMRAYVSVQGKVLTADILERLRRRFESISDADNDTLNEMKRNLDNCDGYLKPVVTVELSGLCKRK